ncbi:MAG: class SAM-dependent methyltransferase [Segetibacter sp.]|jgi:SAM-dependent methyltransferase|nr:class SAM-dependent methyltransferase [Segetibacter sp.]
MFREESLWIKNAIQKLKPVNGYNEVANIGSSTDHFRKVIQPHIHDNIINTLLGSGWNVINVDMKKEPGVDLVADVTKENFAVPFKDRFALTICTNLLEHVEDIELVTKNLVAITRSGGHLLITVPYKYKLHYDPIDNGFRPTPQQIVDLFKDVAEYIVDSKIIAVSDRDQYRIKKSKFPGWGYRERLAYYFGKRHKTSGILFSIKK